MRYRKRWQPFVQAVHTWIYAWTEALPRSLNALILVGPSAGWSLPLAAFKRFEQVVIFEPDAVARALLGARMRPVRAYSVRLHYDHHDLFAAGGLQYLHATYPTAAILFCNVLGQLNLIVPEHSSTAAAVCKGIASTLQDRHWASYHDLISTTTPPQTGLAPCSTAHGVYFPTRTPLEQVLIRFWTQSEIELYDHETNSLGNADPFQCALWQITPARWHLVQWVSHLPASPAPR
ncbi:Hypothetical protein HDN1F_20930 [gamma proteobacterium HdN1]|nr:Hypothetical protein HDN1F_20930 [gamma proteobacterium HdN1]